MRPTKRFYALLERIIAGEGSLKAADKAAGLSPGTLSRWTTQTDREISPRSLIALARNLGEKYRFTREELFAMAGYLESPASVNSLSSTARTGHLTPADLMVAVESALFEVLPPDVYAEVARYMPAVGQEIAASSFSEMVTEYYPAPARTPPNAFIILVTGRCMLPRIAPGARVIVDRDRVPEPGDVVVAVRENEATLKRLVRRDDGSYLLAPDNPLFAPIEMDTDDTRILGVVIDVLTGKP